MMFTCSYITGEIDNVYVVLYFKITCPNTGIQYQSHVGCEEERGGDRVDGFEAVSYTHLQRHVRMKSR